MKQNEEYYFGTTGWDGGTCTEPCLVKNNGVMIGSAKCQECEFLVKKHEDGINEWDGPDWIICSRIKEATDGKVI